MSTTSRTERMQALLARHADLLGDGQRWEEELARGRTELPYSQLQVLLHGHDRGTAAHALLHMVAPKPKSLLHTVLPTLHRDLVPFLADVVATFGTASATTRVYDAYARYRVQLLRTSTTAVVAQQLLRTFAPSLRATDARDRLEPLRLLWCSLVPPEYKRAGAARLHRELVEERQLEPPSEALLQDFCDALYEALRNDSLDAATLLEQMVFLDSVTYNRAWQRPTWQTSAYLACMETLEQFSAWRVHRRVLAGFTLSSSDNTTVCVDLERLKAYAAKKPATSLATETPPSTTLSPAIRVG